MNAKLFLLFRITLIIAAVFFMFCMEPVKPGEEFTFTVIDVGQGLSQIGIMEKKAILWDIGPTDGYVSFKKNYLRLGGPFIEKIIISHSDNDHCGGLLSIDSSINWSGKISVNQYEDTAYLRKICSNWKGSLCFEIVKKGDTIKTLKGVNIHCLWPPNDSSLQTQERNSNSLVFIVKHGANRLLISSDIDSSAQKAIAIDALELKADILVAPHHGSGNFSPFFIHNTNPTQVVISCSEKNSYGHPSQGLLTFLISEKIDVKFTFSHKSITYTSNTYYWEEN